MVTIGGGRVLCPKQLGPGQLDPRAQLSGAQLSTPKKVDSWAQDRCAPDSWVPWPNCPGPRTGGRSPLRSTEVKAGCKESEPGEPLVFQLVQIYWVCFPSATFTFQIIGTGFVLFRIKTYQKSILEFFQLCRAR